MSHSCRSAIKWQINNWISGICIICHILAHNNKEATRSRLLKLICTRVGIHIYYTYLFAFINQYIWDGTKVDDITLRFCEPSFQTTDSFCSLISDENTCSKSPKRCTADVPDLIHLVDSHSQLCDAQRTHQQSMLSGLTTRFKARLELSSAGIHHEHGHVSLKRRPTFIPNGSLNLLIKWYLMKCVASHQ